MQSWGRPDTASARGIGPIEPTPTPLPPGPNPRMIAAGSSSLMSDRALEVADVARRDRRRLPVSPIADTVTEQ
jgi:hypothetical protein